MIKCKDCKHFFIDRKGAGGCYKAAEDPRNHSCIHAERADGLSVCCRDCRHCLIGPIDDCGDYVKCQKSSHTGAWLDEFNPDKMSCPEWQAREEKE